MPRDRTHERTPGASRSRVFVSAAVVTVGILGAGCGSSTPSVLPRPTGAEAVGVRDLAPVTGGFGLRAWYPAVAGTGTPGAPWMTDAQWDAFAATLTDGSAEALARLKTSAAADATPAATDARRPVVLLMPGWWVPAASTTVLAQELASHGLVVITIGSPPGSEPIDGGNDALFAARAEARLAAVRATLELLADQALPDLVGPIDAERVAVGGNSFGGAIGYAASIGEPAVVAVFDLDGSLEILPGMKPVTVPALMVVTLSGGGFDPASTTVQLLRDSTTVVNVGIRRAAHCDLNDLEIVLLATETSPSDFPTGAECFGAIGVDGPTTAAVIVRRFLTGALGTPATLPTGESLIEGQPDGVLDPIGLER